MNKLKFVIDMNNFWLEAKFSLGSIHISQDYMTNKFVITATVSTGERPDNVQYEYIEQAIEAANNWVDSLK